jgi:hypothetical protein
MEQIPRDTKCFPRVSKMAIITNNLYQLVLFPTVDHKTIIIQKFHLFLYILKSSGISLICIIWFFALLFFFMIHVKIFF